MNQAVGTWGTPMGDGIFRQSDELVKPRSLFRAQLADRLGGMDRAAHIGPVGRDYKGATNPTLAEAQGFARDSSGPLPTLRDVIASAREREKLWGLAVPAGAKRNPEPQQSLPAEARNVMAIRSGRLFVGEDRLRGKRFTPIWWRGNIRPGEAPSFGPAITRFVPGRIGPGFSDELQEVARELKREGVAVVEHHHGLWYDRRRDDHTRVRRATDAVVPPFYEQPFARSSVGGAWDGLNRYDLEQFNPWYWGRLQEFAHHCGEEGLVLFNQHYFQHNLLEAGAHWTDFPWREANNINVTNLPEPPPYVGDKRIFQAHLFDDASDESRRPLHRRYIRKHLDAFADCTNVIHSVGAEYTGPLEFVQFWIDVIMEWERETGRDAVVCLSSTRDVQDAILADPARGPAVSVIDIRYWWYTPGGENLSPRQHARQLKPRRASDASRNRAVRELQSLYPEKVILFNGEPVD